MKLDAFPTVFFNVARARRKLAILNCSDKLTLQSYICEEIICIKYGINQYYEANSHSSSCNSTISKQLASDGYHHIAMEGYTT